jgi:hypothetical protein
MTLVLNVSLRDMLKRPTAVFPSGDISLGTMSSDVGKTKTIQMYKFARKCIFRI